MTDPPEMRGAHWLAEGSPTRPRVTLALFAYNQQSYVRAAVEGALAQDYDGPLEIILSDDGSPDETFAVMQQVARAYTGPHHVRLNRNDPNLGLSAHVNRVLSMAQGEIIVMAAGDDVSLPDRVRESVAALVRHPGAMAVSFSDIRIDDSGARLEQSTPSGQERIIDLKTFLAAGPRAQSRLGLSGASRAFRREVFERFGDLLPDCPAEDTPYLRRALYLGNCVRCDWPGIKYRVHAGQMSLPERIVAMKADRFHSQYVSDLAQMGDRDLPHGKIRAHLEAEAIEFALRGLSASGRTPDLRLVLRTMKSPGFSLREKLGLAKRFALRRGMV